MPSACWKDHSGTYAVRHDPFVYYQDIQGNSARCASHVDPFSQLSGDLGAVAATPNYVFITPNTCNDMHDCSVVTGVAQCRGPHGVGDLRPRVVVVKTKLKMYD